MSVTKLILKALNPYVVTSKSVLLIFSMSIEPWVVVYLNMWCHLIYKSSAVNSEASGNLCLTIKSVDFDPTETKRLKQTETKGFP